MLSTGGLVFLSHVEERMDWEIKGMTGTEIYNTHADFSEEEAPDCKNEESAGNVPNDGTVSPNILRSRSGL